MTIGKTATELEAMLMERLRENPSCAAFYRVGTGHRGLMI